MSTGRAVYPRGIPAAVRSAGVRCKVIPGIALAARAGNVRAVNSVVLGALSKLLEFDGDTWRAALERHVPARHLDVNLKAFALGRARRFGGK